MQDLLGNSLADKGARLAADLSEVDNKFVDQVNQVDARTWIVQKRIVQAFRDKLNLDKNATTKAPAKPKVPKAPPLTRQNRVDRLNSFVHKIYYDGSGIGVKNAFGQREKKG